MGRSDVTVPQKRCAWCGDVGRLARIKRTSSSRYALPLSLSVALCLSLCLCASLCLSVYAPTRCIFFVWSAGLARLSTWLFGRGQRTRLHEGSGELIHTCRTHISHLHIIYIERACVAGELAHPTGPLLLDDRRLPAPRRDEETGREAGERLGFERPHRRCSCAPHRTMESRSSYPVSWRTACV